MNSKLGNEGPNLVWIWRLRCPMRVRFILSLDSGFIQEKLNTKTVRKGISTDDICSLCGNVAETTDHLFRSCSFYVMVWRRVGGLRLNAQFIRLLILEWVQAYGLNYGSTSDGIPLGVLFVMIIWGLCKARCKRLFEGALSSHTSLYIYAHNPGKDTA
ncbi:hypothetical protein COLO4_00452 [Corchorus olitorius]|uniref:Reverse transcriptase zinc-binding domain-containing protein n=1 Tax=Corchorus olitorius TaxID=93759 RepID=A0A1R3L2X7_9ROSI|nr:hypothetical protein COLO4_01211 [Corchorus olitorius]OMP14008.1 hypothetical protein COLO4_00452 [Corchorus olitorius]